jgi:hypothetical protein
MNYSVNQLTTVADCDAVLSLVAKEKEDLEWRQQTILRRQASYAESTVEIAAELAAVTAELAAYESILNTLPDGPAKEDAVVKKKKLEFRQFMLNDRKGDFGSVALLEKEMELGQLEKQIAEVDVLAAAVAARKAAL